MLFGLSEQDQAPPIFRSTNKNGVPHFAIIGSSALLLVTKIIKLHLPRCYVSVYLCNNNLDCIIYYRMGINYYCLY